MQNKKYLLVVRCRSQNPSLVITVPKTVILVTEFSMRTSQSLNTLMLYNVSNTRCLIKHCIGLLLCILVVHIEFINHHGFLSIITRS